MAKAKRRFLAFKEQERGESSQRSKALKVEGADFILMAMVAMAASDGRLDAKEIGLIQQIYRTSRAGC